MSDQRACSAISDACARLEVSSATVAAWLRRGVLHWREPGVIDPDELEHAAEVLHRIYDVSAVVGRGMILQAIVDHIGQPELNEDVVFLAHWSQQNGRHATVV